MDKQDLFRRAKDAIVDADEAKALRIIEEAKNAEFDLLDFILQQVTEFELF